MAQRFTSLDDAATQLGISKDRLNQLREAGKVRAYRDGASWKFRSDDIDKLAQEGIPRIDAGASDLALDLDEGAVPQSAAEASGLDLELTDESSSIYSPQTHGSTTRRRLPLPSRRPGRCCGQAT